MLTIQEAQDIIVQHSHSFGTEMIDLKDALCRVTSSDIFSDRNYPPFNRSAMDGFAVKADDLENNTVLNVIEELHAGDIFKNTLGAGECVRIMTGAPVPSAADAVIKSEDAFYKNGGVSFACKEIKRGQNIALCGEDMKAGELLFAKGTMLTATKLGSLAAIGCEKAPVAMLPDVTVFSTGNEVQPVHAKILPQHIRDSNGLALHELLQSYDIQTNINHPLPDDAVKLKESFNRGLDTDILIISGGVSKGVADHVPAVLKEIGVKELFHGVKIKPGKPLWTGIYKNKTMVFALPGNPVSVQVAFKIFIEPYIRKCLGMASLRIFYFPMNILRKARSPFDEYFPVVLQEKNKKMYVQPVAYNGSGDMKVTAHSDGIALQPFGTEILEQDMPVKFYPW